MRAAASAVVELAGMAAIAAGLFLVWPPLGVVSAGVALVVVGAAAARREAQ